MVGSATGAKGIWSTGGYAARAVNCGVVNEPISVEKIA